jgi:hypothetical protein
MNHKLRKGSTSPYLLGDVIMAFRLNVVGVSNLLTLVPVLRLAGLRVPNRLGGKEVPVVLNVAGGLLNVVDEDLSNTHRTDKSSAQGACWRIR